MTSAASFPLTRAAVFDFDSDEVIKLKADQDGIGDMVLTEWGLTVYADDQDVRTFYPMRLVFWAEEKASA